MSAAVLLPPLLGFAAAAAAAVAPRRFAVVIGGLAAALAFALLAPLVADVARGVAATAPFWSVPALGIAGGLRIDGLSMVMALLITGVGALVMVYAGRYLRDDPRLRRLIVLLLLFMAAMLGAVTADDVILLFVFWELTSLLSFLLVGFDHERRAARKAALNALIVTAGGGLALLGGLILLSIAAGTTSITGIIAAREAVLAHPAAVPAMVLILIGCFTKSAQVPFHFWLPGAMAAPTPVSAYLHSATMVKLGVYLLARLNPLYEGVSLWHSALVFGGLATAATGALLSLRERDLKRVLAYTTVTALGTLTLLIGLNTPLAATAAVTFLLVHALYKASLFLIAGIVDHATGTRDAKSLGGLARAMPWTAAAAALAALSMAGLPPFVGFVAKELVYEAKLQAGVATGVVITLGFLVNSVTVAIAAVLSWRIFFGAARATPAAPHDPSPAMLAGPVALAALGLLAGIAPAFIGEAFVYQAAQAIHPHENGVALKLWHGFTPVLGLSVVTTLAGVGLFLAWARLMPRLARTDVFERFGPARLFDRFMAAWPRSAARLTGAIQNGDLRSYLRVLFATVAAGLLAALILRDGLALPAAAPLDARALALVALMVGAVATALAPSVLAAVIASGLAGFSAAMAFLLWGAPDVAFTQFAVETLLVVLLAAVLARLPIPRPDARAARAKWLDGGVALAVGAAVALAVLAVLAAPFDPRLSDWFGAQSVPGGHGRNVVNVVLVDFRALDTLGEIVVLALAAIAVAALMRRKLPELAR